MLLSIDTNTKTVKGQSKGYMTGILYLAPADIVDGMNLCPMAEMAGCKKGCLYTAGRGVFNSVQTARVKKTIKFRDELQEFMLQLVKDIRALIRKAAREGFTPIVRLNGTSDILWERIPVTLGGNEFENIMEVFPDVQFYDYTKIVARNGKIPKNYDLTFSYSATKEFQSHVQKAIQQGMRLAVVFDEVPSTFLGKEVVDGDESDLRFLDKQGVVVGLKAKGKAKKDFDGFVVRKIQLLQVA